MKLPKKYHLVLSLFFLISVVFSIAAQPEQSSVEAAATENGAAGPLPAEKLEASETVLPQSLPNGFSTLSLGMSVEEAKTSLAGDFNFSYRGEPDVSMRQSGDNEIELIQSSGRGFVEQVALQFLQDSLIVISIDLDSQQIDYYSVYATMVEKYGEAVEVSPQRAFWKNDSVEIALERPSTVKYIDLAAMQQLKERENFSLIETLYNRENFLEQF